MQIVLEMIGDVQVVVLSGRMDFTSSNEFQARMESAIAAGARKVLFDLGDLQYISSSGLGVFIFTAKQVQPDSGKVAFTGLKQHVKNVFDMVGFLNLFEVYLTRDEGLDALSKP
jgi:anti-sigma B factor antagonist